MVDVNLTYYHNHDDCSEPDSTCTILSRLPLILIMYIFFYVSSHITIRLMKIARSTWNYISKTKIYAISKN